MLTNFFFIKLLFSPNHFFLFCRQIILSPIFFCHIILSPNEPIMPGSIIISNLFVQTTASYKANRPAHLVPHCRNMSPLMTSAKRAYFKWGKCSLVSSYRVHLRAAALENLISFCRRVALVGAGIPATDSFAGLPKVDQQSGLIHLLARSGLATISPYL